MKLNFVRRSGLLFGVVAVCLGANYGLHVIEDGLPQNEDGAQRFGRMRSLAHEIVNDINDPAITTRNAHGTIVLEGIAATPELKLRAEQIARVYTRDYVPALPRKLEVLNLIEVRPRAGDVQVGALAPTSITE